MSNCGSALERLRGVPPRRPETEVSTLSPIATKQGRGRPRAFDDVEVLEAALELFWDRGYRSTTTRELEEATGLSQSSIYNAFGSKEELLDAALTHYEAMTDAQLVGPLEEAEDGLASLERFFDRLTEWVSQEGRRGCMLINLMAEDGGQSGSVSKRASGYRSRVRAAFRGALERAGQAGESSSDATSARAELLVGLVMGLNIAARGGASRSELDRLRDAIRTQIRSWYRG